MASSRCKNSEQFFSVWMLSTLLAISTLLTYLKFIHLLANSALLLTFVHCAFLQYTPKPMANVPFHTLHPPFGIFFSQLYETQKSVPSVKSTLKTHLIRLLINWCVCVCICVCMRVVCVCVCVWVCVCVCVCDGGLFLVCASVSLCPSACFSLSVWPILRLLFHFAHLSHSVRLSAMWQGLPFRSWQRWRAEYRWLHRSRGSGNRACCEVYTLPLRSRNFPLACET